MSNNDLKKEITILKTWKWEIFEIEMRYEDFLIFEQDLKNKWEDGFNLWKLRRFIKFSSIEEKIWKTKYLSLEEPKKPKKELTDEERKQMLETISEAMERTKEGRKKRFIEYRKKVLKDLEYMEESFNLEKTTMKLEDYKKLKIIFDKQK